MRFAGSPDPRRRPAPALGADAPLINRAAILPGLVESEHVAGQGIDLASVVFDRAGFAFDVTQYGLFPINGATSPAQWTRPGLDPNDVRAYVGPTEEELYVWVWATMGWSNSAATGGHGRATAALYDGINPLARERAANPSSTWIANDGHFREITYQGFFKVPVVEGAEWSIGLQLQFSDVTRFNQQINRQSITTFVSAAPSDAATNTTDAVAGDEA